jgi:hypothetical protein
MEVAMHTRNRNRRGFSLVELLVVTGTLGLISALVVSGLERGQRFANTEMSRASIESKFHSGIDRIRRELAVARVDDPIDSGTRVRYMVPIDADGDGLTYDGNGVVTWGYVVAGVPTPGAAAWFAYVIDQVVDEAGLGLDVNRDGDLLDVFEMGHLEHQTPDGRAVPLTGSTMLQKAGNPGGDVDEDGTLDPLFAAFDTGRARMVRIDAFSLYRLSDGAWRRFDHDSTIRLQNDEP